MKNRLIYYHDPTDRELPNNGVSKVAEIADDEKQISTLRFELETFVCDGEYARGLERILKAFLDNLNRNEQEAVWVSGFFGSGKSHLVKVLRYLWEDYRFADGATARSLVRVPSDVSDLLQELTNRSKSFGGLRAAAGTLGAGTMDNVRLAFIQLVLRAAGLPENLSQTKFLLWLRSSGLEAGVQQALQLKNRDLRREILSHKLSVPLAEALVAADPNYGTPANAQAAIRAQFPDVTSPTLIESIELLKQVLGKGAPLPFTLLVIDEVQQFIGERIPRSMDVQEIAEHCCTHLNQSLLLVGTGQSALNTTPSLQRLQARFRVTIQLSDTDVESVIRKTVLRKKPEQESAIRQALDACQGEISRHLQTSRLAACHGDDTSLAPDYPLLPTRRRFWEKVLRNTDHSGVKAQLRSQLQIVYEAARQTAENSLGTVVAGDFIYDQISTDLLNSGELEREYDEIIRGQRDGTPEGALRSSLCALIFLIGKLPRTPGADDGVRATAESLVDLLVSDLASDRPRLEQQVPGLLKKLVTGGQLMAVETEFRLQTREGAVWTHEYNRRRTAVLNDEARLNARRSELLRDGIKGSLKSLSLQQGASRQPRSLSFELSASRPAPGNDQVSLWLRDGWGEDEKTVINDARALGVQSPQLLGHLPRLHHEELRNAIASLTAATETLEAHGPVTTPEAIEARKAIETHHAVAEHRLSELLHDIISSAKVFLGGGTEANGVELADKVQDAATSAMVRLYTQFADADDANWGAVVTRARQGDVGAFSLVGHPGDVTKHPVCRRVLEFVGAGKKGREIRDHFKSAPCGWPQDAIDGSLYIMLVAGNLRATLNGPAVLAAALPQGQIGVATFHVDVPPLNVQQRLELKALFQRLGVATPNGQESASAAQFLKVLLALGESAGGEAPSPQRPDLKAIRELQMLSGNAQLLDIHSRKDALAASILEWRRASEALARRLPAWETLLRLQSFAASLPEAAAAGASISGITASRSLLSDPDPVPELRQAMAGALRTTLGSLQQGLASAFAAGHERLAASQVWARLDDSRRATLTAAHQLTPPPAVPIGTEVEILTALQASPLADRRNLIDAVPQRFARALDEASQLLEPTAVRIHLPGATIRSSADLEGWISGVRALVAEQLKSGPVIL